MTLTLCHLLDEVALYATYCGDKDIAAAFTAEPKEATCPKCVEAYETRPQLVTTADLAKVVSLISATLRRSSSTRIGGAPDPLYQQLNVLRQKFERPRRINPEEST